MSLRSDSGRQRSLRNIHTNYPTVKIRKGEAQTGQNQSQGIRHRTDGARTLACSPEPLRKTVESIGGVKGRRSSLSAMEDTNLFTGIGRLKTIREDIACCRIKLLDKSK
jgi:hypothetical protein